MGAVASGSKRDRSRRRAAARPSFGPTACAKKAVEYFQQAIAADIPAEMQMRVDQPRQDGRVGKIEHLRLGRNLGGGRVADALDPVAPDHDHLFAPGFALAVEQGAGAEDLRARVGQQPFEVGPDQPAELGGAGHHQSLGVQGGEDLAVAARVHEQDGGALPLFAKGVPRDERGRFLRVHRGARHRHHNGQPRRVGHGVACGIRVHATYNRPASTKPSNCATTTRNATKAREC